MAWWKTRKGLQVTYGAATHIGQVRSENQDSYGRFPVTGTAADEDQLFIVADGMGGHARGREASETAVRVVQEVFFESRDTVPARLRRSVEEANRVIYAMWRDGNIVDRMGTTCTALVLSGSEGFVAHVGDSRLYRVRGNEVTQLSDDHTVVGELQRKGVLTLEEARDHPRRHALIRAVGVDSDVEIDIFSIGTPRAGDTFVLCSDGMSEVPEPEIGRIVRTLPPQEAADELVRIANERGGHDNVTVLIVRIEK
jgi:serine/threonine protein phosphatase PrpC